MCHVLDYYFIGGSYRNGGMAVSYTHLDVYKRQATDSMCWPVISSFVRGGQRFIRERMLARAAMIRCLHLKTESSVLSALAEIKSRSAFIRSKEIFKEPHKRLFFTENEY